MVQPYVVPGGRHERRRYAGGGPSLALSPPPIPASWRELRAHGDLRTSWGAWRAQLLRRAPVLDVVSRFPGGFHRVLGRSCCAARLVSIPIKHELTRTNGIAQARPVILALRSRPSSERLEHSPAKSPPPPFHSDQRFRRREHYRAPVPVRGATRKEGEKIGPRTSADRRPPRLLYLPCP